jgi:hypothetical protein
MSIQLVYPEKRIVSSATVLQWGKDAFANGEAEHEPTNVYEAIKVLEDLGHITIDRIKETM